MADSAEGNSDAAAIKALIERWSVIVGRPAEEMIAKHNRMVEIHKTIPEEESRQKYEEALELSRKSEDEIRECLLNGIAEGEALTRGKAEAYARMSEEEITEAARKRGETREEFVIWRRYMTEVFPQKFYKSMDEYRKLPPRDLMNLVLLSSVKIPEGPD